MDDEDRDAILLRRNRLIGLALAGLATVGCDTVLPGPCLEAMPIESPETTPEDGPQLPFDEHAPPRPVPCLSGQYVDPNAPTDVAPSDETPTDETPTDETPTDETPTDETPTDETPTTSPARRARRRAAAPPEAAPMPCLSESRVPPPEPMPLPTDLRERRRRGALPQPCLAFEK